ncbi:hypothetical protein GCWU000341_01243 [Oribacterium sp. oral taxon 078 str. F0262]|nr:hypothetical protein GCWU000341_01243 [Oribacterium sp. oral taxon 078 str. F0262]
MSPARLFRSPADLYEGLRSPLFFAKSGETRIPGTESPDIRRLKLYPLFSS